MAKMKNKKEMMCEQGDDCSDMMGEDMMGMEKFMDHDMESPVVKPSDPTSYIPIEQGYNQKPLDPLSKGKSWKPKGR